MLQIMKLTIFSKNINVIPDILINIKVHYLQMFLIFSGISFHWNDGFPNGCLDVLTQFFNMWLMFTNRFQQWCSRPKYVLQNILVNRKNNNENTVKPYSATISILTRPLHSGHIFPHHFSICEIHFNLIMKPPKYIFL